MLLLLSECVIHHILRVNTAYDDGDDSTPHPHQPLIRLARFDLGLSLWQIVMTSDFQFQFLKREEEEEVREVYNLR